MVCGGGVCTNQLPYNGAIGGIIPGVMPILYRDPPRDRPERSGQAATGSSGRVTDKYCCVAWLGGPVTTLRYAATKGWTWRMWWEGHLVTVWLTTS